MILSNYFCRMQLSARLAGIALSAIALLAGALLFQPSAHAQSQTRSPAAGNCTNQAGIGTLSWGASAANAVSSNNSYASRANLDNTTSNFLQCLNYGFSIPAGATILGIEVNIERKSNSIANGGSRDAAMRLVKGGVIEPLANDRSTATTYTTVDTVETHGGPTNLWGTTWTPAQINAANFGAAFAATKPNAAGGAHTVTVDHMQIVVYFTNNPPPAPNLVSPANAATVTTATPTFDWTDVVDPDGDTVTYEIQADTGGCSFPAPALNQTGIAASTFSPGAALANGTYCWRARAVDVFGLAGPWSATRVLTINATFSQTMFPNSAGDCTSLGGGGQNWTNPGNAFSSNNARARATLNDLQVTDPLQCLDYRFTIPANAAILGIEVSIDRRASSTTDGIRDNTVNLVKAGSAVGSNGATATIYPTGEAVEVHGNPTDLWGASWTPTEINAANFGVVMTAIKPTTPNGTRTVDIDYMSIRVYYLVPPVVPTPANFNAFETGTAAGATSGVITTKVAGAAFSLDVVAIAGGTQLDAFTDQVVVELLGNNTLGVLLGADNCPTSSTALQTVAPNPTITFGRSTVNFAAVTNSWRDVRVRVRWPTSSPSLTGCSTDNFAIRPASFTVGVTDNDWSTAGTNRSLGNTGATGGAVHKAGQSFTLTVTAAPGTASNYDGDPTVSALACTLPAGCVNGTLAVGTFSGSGARVSNTATYSEVGAFDLTLVDQNYASVDAADGTPQNCTATGRYVCQSSAPLAVGRFVPDRFEFASPSTPQLQTFGSSCASRSFTYVGQPFWYLSTDLPAATINAVNAGGAVTANYAGTLFKLAASGITETYTSLPAGLDLAAIGTASLGAPGAGFVTYGAAAGGTLAYARNAATPVAPFNAAVTVSVTAADDSENGANQGIIVSPTPLVFNGGGGGIAFDSGAAFRYGQVRMLNASGPGMSDLPVTLRAEYYTGAGGFAVNAADHCSSFIPKNFVLSGHQGSITTANMVSPTSGTDGNVSISATLASGVANLRLLKPSVAQPGSARLCLDLDAGTGGDATCQAATPANKSYLQGKWSGSNYDKDPSATAVFGLYSSQPKNFIFFRENY